MQLGEKLAGTLSPVTEFDFLVELGEAYVNRVLYVRTLQSDYDYFDPMTDSGFRRSSGAMAWMWRWMPTSKRGVISR